MMPPMRRIALLVLAALAACSSSVPGIPDTGVPDAGPFAVSGTVQVFPGAARWLAARAQAAPSLADLRIALEDPFVSMHAADAGLAAVALRTGADGRFAFTEVEGRVALGVAAQIEDLREPRLVATSVTLLYEGASRDAVELTVWALPLSFLEALETAAGAPGLEAAGAVLGVVLDAQGNPAAGLSLAAPEPELTARVRYLGEDLAPLPGATATGTSGLFLLTGEVEATNLSFPASPEYGLQKALSSAGRVFLLVFRAP